MIPVVLLWEWIEDLIPVMGSDLVYVKREGDKIVKEYTYRRAKVPFAVDDILMKLKEGVAELPLRNPLSVKIKKIEKLESGIVTEDVKVTVEVPPKGLIGKKLSELIKKAKEKRKS